MFSQILPHHDITSGDLLTPVIITVPAPLFSLSWLHASYSGLLTPLQWDGEGDQKGESENACVLR